MTMGCVRAKARVIDTPVITLSIEYYTVQSVLQVFGSGIVVGTAGEVKSSGYLHLLCSPA